VPNGDRYLLPAREQVIRCLNVVVLASEEQGKALRLVVKSVLTKAQAV
jgi:uncharacterized protein YwbE